MGDNQQVSDEQNRDNFDDTMPLGALPPEPPVESPQPEGAPVETGADEQEPSVAPTETPGSGASEGPTAGTTQPEQPTPTAQFANFPPPDAADRIPGPAASQFNQLPPHPQFGMPPVQPGGRHVADPAYAWGVPPTRKVSRGVWPAVAAVALVLGLVGGGIGGALYGEWQDRNDGPGRNSSGLAGVTTRTAAPLPADNDSIASVAQQLLPSTVQIIADFEGEEGGATGSGFILDEQGHVVTNNHVIEDAAKSDGRIRIVDTDGKRYPAEVVGRSTVYDLAVLYVEEVAGELDPAALGSANDLYVGETVVAIGSPLGLTSTVTAGIVSALNRPVTTGGDADDLNSYINAVQTDAAINPGNSGGPLVNLQGEVVGVNSAIATNGGEAGNIGVGFAIPVEQVRITADQILRDGEAQYPVIGAQVITTEDRDGIRIAEVNKGSAAADAGLKTDDIVRRIDDQVVTDSPSLIVAIRSHVPGDTVKLTVERDGKELDLPVTLDSQVG